MTTDEMILALVEKHGFKLPEKPARCSGTGDPEDLGFKLHGVVRVIDKKVGWRLRVSRVWGDPCDCLEESDDGRVPTAIAHDLCATEFARLVKSSNRAAFSLLRSKNPIVTDEAEYEFDMALRAGDSATVIKAIYDAMEAK